MDEKIEKDILDAIAKSIQTQTLDGNEEDAYSIIDCSEKDSGHKSESELKMQILQDSLSIANKIYKLNEEEENEKKKWRAEFIRFICWLLSITIAVAFVLLILDAIGCISISTVLMISIFTVVVAEICALLAFMVKYINNTQYLQSFETITHKLLDYLVKDKAAKSSSSEEENAKGKDNK
ncbi:MAG: hypothetical protein FWE29_04985 [Defluviitaleaceae bacterium]|nr:hypothetical protein [Defluviitaleaceae bacterium]